MALGVFARFTLAICATKNNLSVVTVLYLDFFSPVASTVLVLLLQCYTRETCSIPQREVRMSDVPLLKELQCSNIIRSQAGKGCHTTGWPLYTDTTHMRWVIFTYRRCTGIWSCTGCTSKRISALVPVYIELFLISVHNTNTVVVTSSSTVAVTSILSFWFVCF